MHDQFGHQEDTDTPRLQRVASVTVNTDGNVAAFDSETGLMHLYDEQDHFTTSFDVPRRRNQETAVIPQVLIAGPNGNYFFRKDLWHVEMYGSTGLLKNINLVSHQSATKLGGLTFANNGHLLVGVFAQEVERFSRDDKLVHFIPR